jgi:hypothetical protein
MTTPDLPPDPLPRWGVIRWAGKKVRCRVLGYHRNGYFFLLAPDDTRAYRHRDSIVFTK